MRARWINHVAPLSSIELDGQIIALRKSQILLGDARHVQQRARGAAEIHQCVADVAISRRHLPVPNSSNAEVIAVTARESYSWCCAHADDGSVFP
jgi:hypothetical protein